MNNKELNKCPFCGGEAGIEITNQPPTTLVHCKNLYCHIRPEVRIHNENNIQEAIELWNKEKYTENPLLAKITQ